MDKNKKTNLYLISEKIPGISKNQSLSKIIELLQIKNVENLPVIEEGKIYGMIIPQDILSALKYLNNNSNIYSSKVTADNIMTKNSPLIKKDSTIEEVLENTSFYQAYIPIVDENDNYTGICVSRKKLIAYLYKTLNLHVISGIATPLGIYLTDGFYQTGAKNLGLFLAGALFAFLAFIVEFTGFFIGFEEPILNIIFKILLFLILFKLLPISSIHATEHKVINAMDKGLPLTYDIVEAQNPVHVRCGTNLFVLALGVLLIFYINHKFLPDIWLVKFFITFGFLFILFSYFKNVSSFLQKTFLTKKTSKKQILQAIHSAEKLLELEKTEPIKKISFLHSFYTSGILQIIVGFLVFVNIINLIFYLVLK